MELNKSGYSISELCKYAKISRASYYKWLTDVTEFKLTNETKAYLSVILDLGDNSIISYVLGTSNNNRLVFDTLDKAIDEYIEFYNSKRIQKRLKGMAPIEYRSHTLAA